MSNVRLVGFSCLCFLLHIAPLCCFSHETVMIDGVVWNYEKTGGGVYLGAWMGATNAVDRSFVGDLVLPNEINGDKVIGICESAFRDCIGITSITFTTNIVSIGNAAFNGCAGLGSISVPNSVTTIGYAIFGGCVRLSDISIPFVGIRRGNDESEAALFGYMFGGTKHEGDVEIFQKF